MDKLVVELGLELHNLILDFKLSAGNIFLVTDSGLVGIGTTQPAQKFQANTGTNSFVVTGLGTIGIGTDISR